MALFRKKPKNEPMPWTDMQPSQWYWVSAEHLSVRGYATNPAHRAEDDELEHVDMELFSPADKKLKEALKAKNCEKFNRAYYIDGVKAAIHNYYSPERYSSYTYTEYLGKNAIDAIKAKDINALEAPTSVFENKPRSKTAAAYVRVRFSEPYFMRSNPSPEMEAHADDIAALVDTPAIENRAFETFATQTTCRKIGEGAEQNAVTVPRFSALTLVPELKQEVDATEETPAQEAPLASEADQLDELAEELELGTIDPRELMRENKALTEQVAQLEAEKTEMELQAGRLALAHQAQVAALQEENETLREALEAVDVAEPEQEAIEM